MRWCKGRFVGFVFEGKGLVVRREREMGERKKKSVVLRCCDLVIESSPMLLGMVCKHSASSVVLERLGIEYAYI